VNIADPNAGGGRKAWGAEAEDADCDERYGFHNLQLYLIFQNKAWKKAIRTKYVKIRCF
jgi:hypothetical protein